MQLFKVQTVLRFRKLVQVGKCWFIRPQNFWHTHSFFWYNLWYEIPCSLFQMTNCTLGLNLTFSMRGFPLSNTFTSLTGNNLNRRRNSRATLFFLKQPQQTVRSSESLDRWEEPETVRSVNCGKKFWPENPEKLPAVSEEWNSKRVGETLSWAWFAKSRVRFEAFSLDCRSKFNEEAGNVSISHWIVGIQREMLWMRRRKESKETRRVPAPPPTWWARRRRPGGSCWSCCRTRSTGSPANRPTQLCQQKYQPPKQS